MSLLFVLNTNVGDVTFGIRALVWVQELNWNLISIKLVQGSAHKTR